MTLQENVAKFSRIVKADPGRLSIKAVQDVARAIIMADTRHYNDSDRGQYERLTLGGLSSSGIKEFEGVCRGCNHADKEWSDVMQMRIMCDVLTILLNGDQPFAMRYSNDVPCGRQRQARGYLEFDDCEKILDAYSANVADFDEELRPVFEQTVVFLKELLAIQSRVNPSQTIINQDCVSEVWLPKEFDSCGFKVRVKAPEKFTNLNGSKVPYIMANNFACIMDVLVKAIVRLDTGDVAQIAFFNRLQEMGRMSPQCFPIGVDIGCSARDAVYTPYHFMENQALRAMYEQYFTKRLKISSASVENTLKAIKVWYKMV